jgi:hypothetical protein
METGYKNGSKFQVSGLRRKDGSRFQVSGLRRKNRSRYQAKNLLFYGSAPSR